MGTEDNILFTIQNYLFHNSCLLLGAGFLFLLLFGFRDQTEAVRLARALPTGPAHWSLFTFGTSY